jgi:cellulose synthase/poly-beta-1,6-N-acetylglucosamine synthase-like glycosyltransferase
VMLPDTRFIQTVSDIDKKMSPLINILIRTHRPELLERCKESVLNCDYDGEIEIRYFFDWEYKGDRSQPYFYNLFCNKLIVRVTDGYCLFIDDDDILIPGSLDKIAPHLEPDRPVICQMLRNGRPKPADIYMDKRAVIKGRIGMPCMIIHSKHKTLYTFKTTEDTDYEWIKTVSETLDCKFIKIPVVDAGKRSHGL